MKTLALFASVALAAAGLLRADGASPAAGGGNLADLQDLEQRVTALEQKVQAQAAITTENKSGNVQETASSVNGFGLYSADQTYGLKLGGLLQFDDRSFFNPGPGETNPRLAGDVDQFLPRRVRLNETAYLGPHADVFLQQEFNGANPVLLDAYGELKPAGWITLRAGVQKTPLSLERWRGDPGRDFTEFSYVGNLVTDRDSGLWLELKDAKQVFYFGAGVFDGSTDTSNPVVADANNDKDGVAKLFIQPIHNVGFGVAASAGDHDGSALPSYKSIGQGQTIFSLSNTAQAKYSGGDYRLIPQGYAFWRQFSVLGEYLHEDQGFDATVAKQQYRLSSEAWDLQAAWVLTGENADFRGVQLTAASRAWGGLEIAGRYSGVNYYSQQSAAETAALLPPKNASVEGARSWDASLIYLPQNQVKVVLDYTVSDFIGGGGLDAAKHPAPLPTEQVLVSRVQFNF